MSHDHPAPLVAAPGVDARVPVENLAGVVFEYSPDRRRLRVRLPVSSSGVVVDLSRAAALDLAEKIGARATEMADPVVPVQQCLSWAEIFEGTETGR
jgi:hypothetical protein